MWRSEEDMLAVVQARAGRRRRRRRVGAGLGSVAAATVIAVIAVTSATASPHPTRVDVSGNGTAPATSTPAGPSPTSVAPTAAGCRTPVPLPADAPIPSANLGAVNFLSPQVGVALSASSINCYVPQGHDMGTEVYGRAQPERLAATTDGGTTWTTHGGTIAAATTAKAPLLEAVVATSTSAVWAVNASGVLMRTTDAGNAWAAQPVATPVTQIARVGHWLWALSCPAAPGTLTCNSVLERAPLSGGAWEKLPVPGLAADSDSQLVVASPRVVLLFGSHYGDAPGNLLVTTDSGASWRVQPSPGGPGGTCASSPGLTAAAGPDDWWFLCGRSDGMGSGTKTLIHTVDAGHTWTPVSSVTNLATIPPPDSITYGNVTALAAGSPTLLWLAWENGLDVSTDAGRTWPDTTTVAPQGTPGSFDIYSAHTAWFLAPEIGLWATTDGTTWHTRGASSP